MILGVPLHPLLVHFAVVLLLAAAGAQVLAVGLPRFRRWLGWGLPALGVVTAVVVRLTQAFGDVLMDSAAEYQSAAADEHGDWGEMTGTAAIVLALLMTAHWAVTSPRWAARTARWPRWVVAVVAALAVVAAVVAMVLVTITGHTGAQSVWTG